MAFRLSAWRVLRSEAELVLPRKMWSPMEANRREQRMDRRSHEAPPATTRSAVGSPIGSSLQRARTHKNAEQEEPPPPQQQQQQQQQQPAPKTRNSSSSNNNNNVGDSGSTARQPAAENRAPAVETNTNERITAEGVLRDVRTRTGVEELQPLKQRVLPQFQRTKFTDIHTFRQCNDPRQLSMMIADFLDRQKGMNPLTIAAIVNKCAHMRALNLAFAFLVEVRHRLALKSAQKMPGHVWHEVVLAAQTLGDDAMVWVIGDFVLKHVVDPTPETIALLASLAIRRNELKRLQSTVKYLKQQPSNRVLYDAARRILGLALD